MQANFFFKPKIKHKILVLCDHPLSVSGVGVQARFLIEGLIKKGNYSFRCLGGAMKHENYNTIQINPDFIIKPVDGFGTPELIRQLLLTERPDAILIFTDPRQFIWLWEMEDEIHQICPIIYWHVWDNDPYPDFNKVWYDSTDQINCISKKTFDLVKPNFPEKTNYIPHTFPDNVYYQLSDETIKQNRIKMFGQKADWFIGLWVNRNATRKMPNDILNSWKLFLDNLEKKYNHKNALLLMHTDPKDIEGPNLIATVELLGLAGNVLFSNSKFGFDEMNMIYNSADFVVNISKAEGFGLSTFISLKVGRPIIANLTGGMIEQVIDSETNTEFGVAIKPAARTLVGSQLVPYIFDDHVNFEDVSNAYMKLFEMGEEGRKIIGEKSKIYINKNYNYNDMINAWDSNLTSIINEWKTRKPKRWTLREIKNPDGPRQLIDSSSIVPVTKRELKTRK